MTDTAASRYEASPHDVHVARLWLGSWGPYCQQRLWEVPLIHPEQSRFATCPRCRALIADIDKGAEGE